MGRIGGRNAGNDDESSQFVSAGNGTACRLVGCSFPLDPNIGAPNIGAPDTSWFSDGAHPRAVALESSEHSECECECQRTDEQHARPASLRAAACCLTTCCHASGSGSHGVNSSPAASNCFASAGGREFFTPSSFPSSLALTRGREADCDELDGGGRRLGASGDDHAAAGRSQRFSDCIDSDTEATFGARGGSHAAGPDAR